jgi:hypothetical protein
MEVKLKRTFFIDGIQYRKGVNTIPEEYRDKLPKTAEILDEEEVKAVAKATAKKKKDVEPVKTLAEIGEEMGLADASVKLE